MAKTKKVNRKAKAKPVKALKKSSKPRPAKPSKKVGIIQGLVLLRSKHAVSDEKGNITEVGISLAPQDEQDVTMEISVTPALADSLKVDTCYNAAITKGKGDNDFTVKSLSQIHAGRHDEKVVVNGAVRGHLHINIKPEQEDFFSEESEYSLALTEVETEG